MTKTGSGIDQSATSIQILLKQSRSEFLMTSHVRSALWTLNWLFLSIWWHWLFEHFRLFLNNVLTPPLPSYILRPMSSQCMNILYVQQQNIPNHCLFAWLIASFLALDRRGRTVSENFRFSLCESRHNDKIKNSEGAFSYFGYSLILLIVFDAVKNLRFT